MIFLAPVLCLAVAGAAPATPPALAVKPGTPTVEVDGQTWLLLEGERRISAVAERVNGKLRLSVDVLRLGDPADAAYGEASLIVTVDGVRNALPNRPPLDVKRAVGGLPGVVASFPVRYDLPLPRQDRVVVTVSLRKQGLGILAGVRLGLKDPALDVKVPLASLDGGARAAVTSSTPLSMAPPAVTPPAVTPAAVTPAPVAVAMAGVDDAGPGAVAPAPEAAPPPPPVVPPPPPPRGHLVVKHKDAMGDLFRLTERTVTLDGQVLGHDSIAGKEALKGMEVIYDGPIAPGNHNLDVTFVYAGQGGTFFSYLEGFMFYVNQRCFVAVGDGKTARVTLVGQETGTFFTELEDRPGIDCDVKLE